MHRMLARAIAGLAPGELTFAPRRADVSLSFDPADHKTAPRYAPPRGFPTTPSHAPPHALEGDEIAWQGPRPRVS